MSNFRWEDNLSPQICYFCLPRPHCQTHDVTEIEDAACYAAKSTSKEVYGKYSFSNQEDSTDACKLLNKALYNNSN